MNSLGLTAEILLDHHANARENVFSDRARTIGHVWTLFPIGGSAMKQINLYDYFVLGKVFANVAKWRSDTLRASVEGDVINTVEQLRQATREDTPFLVASRNAAQELCRFLEERFDDELSAGFFMGDEANATLSHIVIGLQSRLQDFDTAFRLDTPHIMAFTAPQKGIYDTRALVNQSNQHLPATLNSKLSAQAKADMDAAGRCLAFEIFTASAFHMWRALETVFGDFHVSLTGKTFAQANVERNWFKYIAALKTAGADSKITNTLDHIRAEYRNPIMHPNENVSPDEAFSLFGIGIAAITQVLQAI